MMVKNEQLLKFYQKNFRKINKIIMIKEQTFLEKTKRFFEPMKENRPIYGY